MNQLIAHPRCGRILLEQRVRLFIWKFMQQEDHLFRENLCQFTHWSYEPEKEVTPYHDPCFPQVSQFEKIFVLLRDVPSIVNSFFHLIQFKLKDKISALRSKGIPANLDDFVKSVWGTERIVHFFNQIAQLESQHSAKISYITYDTLLTKGSVELLPEILGVDIAMQQADIDWIYRLTQIDNVKAGLFNQENLPCSIQGFFSEAVSGGDKGRLARKGYLGNYRESLSKDSIQYINSYVSKHCTLKAYYKYYGAG